LIDTGKQNHNSGVLIPEGSGGRTAAAAGAARAVPIHTRLYSYHRASTSACPERYRLKPKPYSYTHTQTM